MQLPEYFTLEYTYITGECHAQKTPHSMKDRHFPFIVIVYVRQGAYYVKTPDTLYTVHRGEAITIAENLPHTIFMDADGELDWMHICCRCCGRDVLCEMNTPRVFHGVSASRLSEACEALAGLKNEARQISPLLTAVTKDAQLSSAVGCILQECKPAFRPASQPIASALGYIHSNIGTQLTIPLMAKAAGLSVSAFERRFKAEIHQTPLQYITTRRMQLAGQMLLQGHLVYEVADALGYRDPLYFSKVFRKHIGMPPGSYVAYYNTRQDTK